MKLGDGGYLGTASGIDVIIMLPTLLAQMVEGRVWTVDVGCFMGVRCLRGVSWLLQGLV